MKVPEIFDTEDHVTIMAIENGLALYDSETILFVIRSGILRHSFPVAIAKVPFTVNQDLKVLSLFLKELNN
jgi:type I restriction enzyme, S subunit